MPALMLAMLLAAGRGEPGGLTLRELIARADAIVIGRVAEIRGSGERRRAVLDVETTVRGTSAARLEFDASTGSHPAFPPIAAGTRWMVFLRRPAHGPPGALEPVFPTFVDAARFPVAGEGVDQVVDWNPGVAPPPRVAIVKGRLPLSTMLEVIKTWSPGKRPATYRVKTFHCPRCKLEDSVRVAAGPEAIECGSRVACVLKAAKDKKPFASTIAMRGIDSAISGSYVGNSAGVIRVLRYDSDISGGRSECKAAIFSTTC